MAKTSVSTSRAKLTDTRGTPCLILLCQTCRLLECRCARSALSILWLGTLMPMTMLSTVVCSNRCRVTTSLSMGLSRWFTDRSTLTRSQVPSSSRVRLMPCTGNATDLSITTARLSSSSARGMSNSLVRTTTSTRTCLQPTKCRLGPSRSSRLRSTAQRPTESR